MQKQTVATQNQYDMVANWDWSDIEEITGLSRIQIISDISKTLQVVPKASQGDIITDIVGEALPQEDQGVKREIVNRVEELIKEE
jgi:DNA mismatch repair protein MutH